MPGGATGDRLVDLAQLPNWSGEWVAAGDFNVDIGRLRSEQEADLAAAVESWAADRGVVVAGPGGPTCRSPTGQSWASLDWVATSA
eukprot:2444980-Alexandrium_andersonii.AAC.1